MKVTPIKTGIFGENENLLDFIISYVKKLKDNSILVVTSKIVALSEGRVTTVKNEKEKEELIKKEWGYFSQLLPEKQKIYLNKINYNGSIDSVNFRDTIMNYAKGLNNGDQKGSGTINFYALFCSLICGVFPKSLKRCRLN